MFARVFLIHSRISLFIPCKWILDFPTTHIHNIDKTKEFICFYSSNHAAEPNFNILLAREFNRSKDHIYLVNITKVFTGHDVKSYTSEDNASDIDQNDYDDSGLHILQCFINGSDKDFDKKLMSTTNVSDVPTTTSTSTSPITINSNKTTQTETELIHAIEQSTEDSSLTRENGLLAIAQILIHQYHPHLIEEYKIKMMNIIERAIRHGEETEQSLAIELVPMLMLQVKDGTDVVTCISPILLNKVENPLVPMNVRMKCCSSMALLHFLGGADDTNQLLIIMKHLNRLFVSSYANDSTSDKSTITGGTDVMLHCVALNAWGLLLTILPPKLVFNIYTNNVKSLDNSQPSLDNLTGMLKSPYQNMQLTAAEVIAILVECGRLHNVEFLADNIPLLSKTILQLANNSDKLYTGVHDRKIQQVTFREIWQYLNMSLTNQLSSAGARYRQSTKDVFQGKLPPSFLVRFGGKETLQLDTWSAQHQYKALVSIIGPSLTEHITENALLCNLLHLNINDNGICNNSVTRKHNLPTSSRCINTNDGFREGCIHNYGNHLNKRST